MKSVEKIDWELLGRQKLSLVAVLQDKLITEHQAEQLEGILNLLDEMTDENYHNNPTYHTDTDEVIVDDSVIGMDFESSHGTLIINEKGEVLPSSDISDWLETIGRVDVEELHHYYSINELGQFDSGDVMDFGYWDKDGVYFKPDMDWRLEMFHNQDFSEVQTKKVVKKSFEWIEKNRK